ncbi:hypothetical protein ALQ68_200123 [Pseudomonas savastanoi pv. glycinea]|nr:hypothetical protein ALQ68_200123 [Pseudomonas savastanoi pv. glycinea]RMP53722.1 hypothetical protein ALQ21_200095 [Pseudomonas savastanoi pv. glycinea]
MIVRNETGGRYVVYSKLWNSILKRGLTDG